jgi:hypothetical protein
MSDSQGNKQPHNTMQWKSTPRSATAGYKNGTHLYNTPSFPVHMQ